MEPEYIPTQCAELFNAKWRGGSTATQIKLKTSLKYQRFSDWVEPVPVFNGFTENMESEL
jgi:hypothetical protein